MKKVLIMCNEFYPIENANTNCMYKIIYRLQELGYQISVISVRDDGKLAKVEKFKDVDIFRVHTPERETVDAFFYRISNRILNIPLIPVVKLIYLYLFFLKKHRVKKLYKQLCKDGDFEYLLSVLKPDDNHEFAYTITSKRIKWIMINFDPYVYNRVCSHSIVFTKFREKKWLSRASGVINIDGIPQENQRNKYNPYKKIPNKKILLPNLDFTQESVSQKNDKFVLRYTGSLYMNKAENDSLVSFLEKLPEDKFSAEFYGSCCNLLKENYQALPKCVNLMGFVQLDECRKRVFDADALINISTNTSYIVPSKILEYIATGKPIINFYHTESDPSFSYLDKYPLTINIQIGTNVEDINSTLEYIYENKKVPIEELKTIYKDYLSKDIVNDLVDFIEGCV